MYSDNVKLFEFSMRSDDGSCNISFELPLDCSWYDIVPFFNQFLAGCGYIPREYNRFVEEIEIGKGE